MPITLFNSSFSALASVASGTTTTVRFSAASTAASHDFHADPVNIEIVPVNLDVDGSGGIPDDAHDGVLILRYLFGFRGQSLIENALGTGATRTDAAAIASFLDSGRSTMLDADGNGMADALTDGILIRRYLSGWTGQQLVGQPVADALATNATRTDPAVILAHLNGFMPAQGLLAEDEPSPMLALQAASRQIVTPDPVSQTVNAGEPVILHVNYSTDPPDSSVTGLGLRMHYNSHLLSFGGIADRLGTGFVQQQTPVDDAENFDNDPLTDKYVLISWADMSGDWPGQLNIRLFTSNYTAGQSASGSTSVNFTASSTAAGWTFDATPAVINFQTPVTGSVSGWAYVDANRNGRWDAGECLPGVTISIAGAAQKATTTDDNGWYQFQGLPVGSYQVSEAHPRACLPGGPDSIAVNVEGGKDQRADFWDAGLRPECIPNRLLATSSYPVGSARWNQVIRETLARAEQEYGQSAPTSAAVTHQPAVASQPSLAAQPVIAAADAVVTPTRNAATTTVAPSAPQVAAAPAQATQTAVITQEAIAPIVEEAIARWAATGLDQQTLTKLRDTSFVVSNLPGAYLGMADHGTVYLDQDAAGRGWFVDPTPKQDEEFSFAGSQFRALDPRAIDRMDLLSVVAHELGHVAGLPDSDIDAFGLMNPHLGRGLRRIPGPLALDAVFASGLWGE